MNVEATFDAARQEQVLTVPMAALRTDRDLSATARLLGRPEQELAAEVGRAQSERRPDIV